MTEEKIKKGLFLPKWIVELLDKEGDRLGGKQQGVAAAAAILMFSEADDITKAACVRRVQERHLTDVYGLIDGIVQGAIEAGKKPPRPGRKSKKKKRG